MADFLILQLKAPLASFGSGIAEARLTDTSPRQSAVTGLLGAALGIQRDDPQSFQDLVRAIKMAVVVLREPVPLTDFHTVQAPMTLHASSRAEQIAEIKKAELSAAGYKRTIVTRRDYLQNGHWLVALCGEPALLTTWKAALEAPKFTLYLGRKSCPLSAFTAPVLISADTLEAAIPLWSNATGVQLPRGKPLSVRWGATVPCSTTPLAQVRRNDVRTSQMTNHFSARTEYVGSLEF
jgi:CRISPR system Cascade subunit CasD